MLPAVRITSPLLSPKPGCLDHYTVKENTEALGAATEETGLEANDEKTEVYIHVARSECTTN